MQAKRYFAPDMRRALKLVREDLGDSAIILHNKVVKGGVELIASQEDENTIKKELEKIKKGKKRKTRVLNDKKPELEPKNQEIENNFSNRNAKEVNLNDISETVNNKVKQSEDRENNIISLLKEELNFMKILLKSQYSDQVWENYNLKKTTQSHLLKKIISFGFSPKLAYQWVNNQKEPASIKDGFRGIVKDMMSCLQVPSEELIKKEGAIALVGSTGSGKTTTIGKLAARYVMQNDTASIGIISTDSYRVGGRDQIMMLAKIIGVPMLLVDEHYGLETALSAFSEKKLILIDTAGLTRNDEAWLDQKKQLSRCGKNISSFLVSSATNQYSVQVQSIKDYDGINLSGCILTKLDECIRLGDSISAIIENQLQLHYVTTGLRIPDDIEIVDPMRLIKRAMLYQDSYGMQEYELKAFFESGLEENVKHQDQNMMANTGF